MKGIMYHYVRKPSVDLPNFIFLHVDNFEKQLDSLARKFRILDGEELEWCVQNKKVIPNSIILTFDDGLSDHYKYVFPILKRRGLSGFFYVPSLPYVEKRLLDVHRTHFLLGKYDGIKVFAELQRHIANSDFMEGKKDFFQTNTYLKQENSEWITQVKQLINYQIKPSRRTEILTKVMNAFTEDEVSLAKEFYLSKENIHEMVQNKMYFGSHSHSHTLLSNLSPDEQENEIDISLDKVKSLLGGKSLSGFCYPYGGKISYNEHTLKILEDRKVQYAFSVESRDITESDLVGKFEIPRFDCNEFEHGKATKGS